MSHTSPLDAALSHYEVTINGLEKGDEPFSAKAILSVLIARDSVQQALTDISQVPSDKLITLIQLDDSLQNQADKITHTVSLVDWRRSFNPPQAHWWWFLETPAHRLDRFDWLWNALTVTSLTASLSLVVDISSRFLSSGIDLLGSFAVISQSTLTLLTAGGVLTEAGRIGIEQILSRLGIKKYLWQEVKLGLSGFLLLSLIGFRLSLPQISDYFNERGLENYIEGDWAEAQSDYERAFNLDPDNAEAHYNLGRLYEDLQQFDQAKIQYQLAAQGGLDVAYNALGRLSIQNRKYREAVSLLLRGLELAPKDDQHIRYALWKNLGWARLKQGRYAEAESNLKEAITLNQDTQAAPHCLLAQVFERQNSPQKALREWETCLRHADGRDPDEDAWIEMARQRVDSPEKK